MVSRCRTCSRRSSRKRRRLDGVTRTSYRSRLGRLRGLCIPYFSFRGCAR